MRSLIQKDDYIGFTYAGIHTSQLGLKSVTGGDRYQRYLSPEFTDSTAQRIGTNGTHYFGTNHTRKVFNFNIAFDDLSELEYRELKMWLNSDISELILDELPYIKYYAKIQNIVQISFLTFMDENDERVLKGELQLSFVCYDPYGYSTYKWLELYDAAAEERHGITGLANTNMIEWADSSRLLYRQNFTYTNLIREEGKEDREVQIEHHIDQYTQKDEEGYIEVYNGGDLPSHFQLQIPIIDTELELTLKDPKDNSIGYVKFDFSKISQYTNSGEKIIIDTYKRLIYIKDGETKIPFNSSLKKGNFFMIPVADSIYEFNKIYLKHPDFTRENITLDYDYRYL